MLSVRTQPAERARGCNWVEAALSFTDIAKNRGTVAGAPIIDASGIYFDGTDDAIAYDLTGKTFYSFDFEGVVYSADEQIFQIATGVDVSIVAGSIVGTGFTAPTYYVNGAATAVCPIGERVHIAVVTGTALAGGTAYLARVGAAFGNIRSKIVRLWNAQLTLAEAADYFHQRVF